MRAIVRGISMLFLGLALLGLGCKTAATAPTSLSYSTNPAVYIIGTAIPANTPTHSGGDIDSYSVSPALPAGLSLDPKSGVISGTPTTATAAASYTVTATNAAGSITFSLRLTVNSTASSITITTQPANQSVIEGAQATFSVTATGSGTLSYQWQKNSAAIAGATAAAYTTPVVTLADTASTFGVQVSDAFGGSVASATATLTVVVNGPGLFTATQGSLAIGRDFHTATRLNNGTVLIVGGSNLSASLQTAELYDPATDTFKATGSLQNARQKHTATLLSDGKVLIAGGIVGAGGGITVTTAEIYDPKAGTFTLTAGNPMAARSEHTATLLPGPGGKVLIVAGRNQANYVTTAELYDPATGTFALTVTAPLASRATHTATLLPGGKVLIAGGFRSGALSSAELYDPATGAFTLTGSLTTPRAQQTATLLLPSGKVLMVGGAATATAELFDPTSGTNGAFAATGSLTTARAYGHTATRLSNGTVLIAGGAGTGIPALILAAAELFDPNAGTFSATSGTLVAAREYHSATLLTDGRVLLSGGAAGTVIASAELFY